MVNRIKKKICRECKEIKLLTQFDWCRGHKGRKNYGRKRWRRNICIECRSRKQEKVRLQRRKNYKKKAVELLGGKCQKCGYNRCLAALDFHHKEKKVDKEKNITRMLRHGTGWEKIKKELRKCELLCANCHRELHNNFENAKR